MRELVLNIVRDLGGGPVPQPQFLQKAIDLGVDWRSAEFRGAVFELVREGALNLTPSFALVMPCNKEDSDV